MNYSASYDKSVRIMTVIGLIILGSVIAFNFYEITVNNGGEVGIIPNILIMILLFSVILFTFLFAPKGYVINESGIVIDRLFSQVLFSSEKIRSVRVLAENELDGAIRTFGVGGLFGYYGRFRSDALKGFSAYATQWRNFVLIETTEGKKIVLTPDEMNGFVNDAKRFEKP